MVEALDEALGFFLSKERRENEDFRRVSTSFNQWVTVTQESSLVIYGGAEMVGNK